MPEVLVYMIPMMFWGGFQAFFSGAIPSIATILRLIDKPFHLTFISLFTQIFLFDGLTYIALFVLEWDGEYLMPIWIFTSVIFTVGTIISIVCTDW